MQDTYKRSESTLQPDEWLLMWAAKWKLARSKAKVVWATGDKNTIFGLNDRVDLIVAPSYDLDAMKDAMHNIQINRPETILGATEVLNVVLDILVERQLDPECVLSDGPIIELLVNVRKQLERSDSCAKIGYLDG